MSDIGDLFNSREIAIGIWILIFLIITSSKPSIRSAFLGVIKIFLNIRIVIPVVMMAIYVWIVVFFLKILGIWELNSLKNTFVWFTFGAMAMLIRFVTEDETDNVFSTIFTDSVKVVILMEFLVNTYTFPLLVEIFLMPFIAFVAMLGEFARLDEGHKSVVRLIEWVQVIVGSVIILYATSKAISEYQNFDSIQALKSITLAPILSCALFPFIYIMLIYSKFELIMNLLRVRVDDKGLRKYARNQFLIYGGLKLNRYCMLLRVQKAQIRQMSKKVDVDDIIRNLRFEK